MVKSKPSMTGSGVVHSSAGDYPKQMESLIDENGHVSLDPEKYEGYTEDEVTAFFASRDYEVSWITSEDGKLWFISSDFAEESVENTDRNNIPRDKAWEVIRSDFEHSGSRIVHHHNHPITGEDDSGRVDIFSRSDFYYYADMASKYPKDGHNVPYFNVFKVHTKQGDTFSFRYNDPGTSGLMGLADDYSAGFSYAASLARKRIDSGKIPHTNRAAAEFITDFLVDDMRSNAYMYGGEFETNWKKKHS